MAGCLEQRIDGGGLRTEWCCGVVGLSGILRQLLAQPNRVFERETLIATLYGNEHAVSLKAIDVHVHHLRAKLGREAGRLIQTVRGFGYKISSQIENGVADA